MSSACPSCNTPVADDARFCANCGASLAVACDACQAEIPFGSRFCPSCGTPTEAEGENVRPGLEERKVVSVLFVDLVGFTAHTAQSDPEDVRARLTVYHREIRKDVERFGGRVEKLMGDGVFAVFGAPAAHEDDPERAVRAALRMQRSVDDLNTADPELSLSIRTAVTTGEAIVQISGEDPDREGIIGDVVNTASRLEAVAPPGGIVVDERTYLATRHAVIYADLDSVAVKGKLDPLPIWQPLEARSRFGVDVDRRHVTPFVGRDAELGVLVDGFERTVDEQTVQLVTIIGEPGVGKSRLLAEFWETIDARSDLVWWRQGRCLAYGEGITFWALAEIVKAHAGILDSDGKSEARTKLQTAVKALVADPPTADWVRDRLAPLAGLDSAVGTVDQAEMFSAWSRFFESLAERNPLVLVIEDLHWADEAMLDFLEHLTEWAVSSPILVVVTARPELFSMREAWGGGKRNAATIGLSPLNSEQAGVLLAALLDSTVLDASVQQAILERSAGNPLYVNEFVRLVNDQGLLDDAAGVAELPLPDSVQSIVAARLDLLGPDEKSLLQAASVIGKVFWAGALQALRPALTSTELARGLIRRELIRPVRDSSMQGQDAYAFSHSLIREVAYGQIPRIERVQLHQAAATWIEAVAGQRGSDTSEVMAFHLSEVLSLSANPSQELRMQCYRVNMLAGERLRGLNPNRSVDYYRAAAESALPGRHRARALLESGRLIQNPVEIRSAYDEALDLYRDAGDVEGQAAVLSGMSQHLWWRGDTAAAHTYGREAVELVEGLPASRAKASVLAARARSLYLRGQAIEALEMAERAAPLVAEMGDFDDQISLLFSRGGAAVELGDVAGIRYVEDAAAMALDRNMTGAATTSLNNLATMTALVRSTTEALAQIETGIDLADSRGLGLAANWLRFTKTEVLLAAGRWEEGLELADRVMSRDAEIGGSQAGVGAAAMRATMLFYRGHREEARDLHRSVLDSAREIEDKQVLAPALAFSVTLANDAGDGEAIVALAEEFEVATADAPAFRSYFLGDVAEALANVNELELLDRLVSSVDPKSVAGRIQVRRAEGSAALTRGDFAIAEQCFVEAVSLAQPAGRVLDAILACIGQAKALASQGRDEELSALLIDLTATVEQMGATVFLRSIAEIRGGPSPIMADGA